MPKPPTELQRLLEAEPDLVDRIFDYVVELIPELRGLDERRMKDAKQGVRDEFAGTHVYLARRRGERSKMVPHIADQVLTMFNGRNASEVARKLGIGRTTVYRVLKQSGK